MVRITVYDGVKYLCCFLFFGILRNAPAQSETANWVFNEYTLNFYADLPAASPTIFEHDEGEFASYSSDQGKLLIATDGSTVWNGEGKIMKNGVNITPYRTRSIIIPKPASNNQFYIFSYNAFNVPANNNNTLSVIVYAVVDLASNNNEGEVIEKNRVLYNNMHGTFTISGKCDRSVFWLIGDVDSNLQEGSDKMYIFQIDKDGISGPFTSKPVMIGSSNDYKLSPDAKKFLYSVSEISGSGTLISDFKPQNFPADPIVNSKWLPVTGSGEFSPNGRFIYIVGRQGITQYDIQTEKSVEIFSGSDFLGRPQIAANGKIYIPIADEKKLLVINKPDQPGLLCEFSETGISIPSELFVLPEFASNLFYNGNFAAGAGEDKEICEGETVKIGNAENTSAAFTWSPATWLDDPAKSQPTFQYTGAETGIESFKYKLTATFEGCEHHDWVVIRVNNKPQPVIHGSKSVCPGVEGVQYWTDENAAHEWTISGGKITGSANSDTLMVNWGLSNPAAKVGLQVTNANQCKSDVATLDVLVNVALQTETPQGLDSVCVNLADKNRYKITNTAGSIYTWEALNGVIIKGDGTNSVFVNWNNNAGKIWVKEKSITSQAVCFGNSDTLNITVFKDPAVVHLDYVTVDDFDDKVIHLQASTSFANRINEVSVLARQEGAGLWEDIGNLQSAPVMQLTKGNFLTDDYSYQFQVSYQNKCEEWSSGKIHKSIRLTALEDEENNLIDLGWSAYNFWTDSNVRYEVWWSLGDDLEYEKEGTTITDTLASINAVESFSYLLKVKAVRSDGVFTSLSNEVKVDFERELVIPNVITPNQDGFNDTFRIKNIELYPVNRLIIFNRYGKVLFDQPGYRGEWNGSEVSAGIYYFTLLLPEQQKEYKGWLQVIR